MGNGAVCQCLNTDVLVMLGGAVKQVSRRPYRQRVGLNMQKALLMASSADTIGVMTNPLTPSSLHCAAWGFKPSITLSCALSTLSFAAKRWLTAIGRGVVPFCAHLFDALHCRVVLRISKFNC